MMQKAETDGAVDVFECVGKFRQQRMNMVQTLVSGPKAAKCII